MTTTLLKYILKGMLKGVEDYEAFIEKEHIDPKGKLEEILPKKLEDEPKKPESKKLAGAIIDLDDLLKGI